MDLTSPGSVLGNRYRLVEPLARGGMATVWIADDPVLSRRVAVKILRSDLAADDATRARFRNEAIAAARLNHPNIVSTFDTGDDDGTAYIVMELVDGTNLRQLIDEHPRGLPVADVLRMGRQIAEALDAAHRAGLVHRDVKPANVLVPAATGSGEHDGRVLDGPIKVTDFGIAKATGADELTRTGTVMGTARYLAPEQVNGRTADARTDVYALGLLLYEMSCGHPPFGGDTDIATAMARLTTSPPSIRAERPEVPRGLDDLVHRCLARDPEQRFASAAAVGHALDIVAGSVRGNAGSVRGDAGTTTAPKPPATTRPATARVAPTAPAATATAASTHRRRKRGSWLWIVVVLIVAAAAGVGAYLLVRDQAGGNGNGSGGNATAPPASAAAVTVTDFDPFDPDLPKSENHAAVGNVLDGDSTTVWATEQYQNFSEKPGVGLRLGLAPTSSVHTVTVTTKQAGWSGSIYVSTADGATLTSLADWGDPVATGSDLGESHTFNLDPSRTGQSVLVWFTTLPTHDDGKQWLEVNEVTLA